MGSSASDEPNISDSKAIDASVGSLVWVRRRNGSWWPGRIMGMDEISEDSLVSPRSGTPVKLLGREDASVDWYNLEKSKRVKAFRCGEYDEYIEKARAAAANGNRKAVKYARREDAILHALEIENARPVMDHLDVVSESNNLDPARESTSMSLSGKVDEDNGSDNNSGPGLDPGQGSDIDSAPELSQSGISFEEPNHVDATKVPSLQGKRRKTPNDSEDDGMEGTKRMRGLEDLGMGIADSNVCNGLSNGSPVTTSKGCSPSLKRKRSQVANVHEFLKRRNRRRPLTKVLESTAMVSVPVSCDHVHSQSGSPLEGLSGLESNESRKGPSVGNTNSDSTGVSCENGTSLNPSEHACDVSLTDKVSKDKDTLSVRLCQNDSSDRLLDVPAVEEEKPSAGLSPTLGSYSPGQHPVNGSGEQSGPGCLAESASLQNEGLKESASAPINNISQKIESGTSKWQIKGKRNSRHTKKGKQVRKYMDLDEDVGAYFPVVEQLDGLNQNSDGTLGFDSNLDTEPKHVAKDELDGFQDWNRSYTFRDPHGRGNTEDVALPPQRLLPYRQSRFMLNSRYESAEFPVRKVFADAKLYNVKLEVKSNYRPQHVPLVSLMSKFNGKAIIGHPLTVEVLGDGACDLTAGSITTTPAATVAKSSKKNSGGGGRVVAAKRMSRKRRLKRKGSKMRKTGLLSKKTRKLSSLTGNKKVEDQKSLVEKANGSAAAAVVACIPLKLVFSRINEAVNGSARHPTHPSSSNL
ncbi:Uncharacterized protein At1g51745 [Linum perenne]